MYAIILAAGASTRYSASAAAGGIAHAHKATADLGDGEPLVGRCARIAREAGLEPVVVVGAAPERVAAAVAGLARVVINAQWHLGRTRSIQAGLAACNLAGPALIWPVDVPCVTRADVERLVLAATVGRSAVVAASDGCHAGHPVVLADRARPIVLDAHESATFREITRNIIGEVAYVSLEHSGCTINIDDLQTMLVARRWLTSQ